MSLPILAESDQAAFDADMEYMRGLVDRIDCGLSPLLNSLSVGDQFLAVRTIRAAEMFPNIELTFSEPWPHDAAADLIAAWNAEVSA
ncbi:hypothetical protein [Mycolicibacterium fortuitum]|uniref:hypothetical protein n=1 Tax=Mycolicibacterium fortuitum TaxID=1766 RepID=UPI003AAACCAA